MSSNLSNVAATLTSMTTTNSSIVQHTLSGLLEPGGIDAVRRALSADFIHHRPDSTSTKEEWLAGVAAALDNIAGFQLEVLQVMAEGDLVMMHSRRWLPDNGTEIVVVDIWRFEEGLIAEGWEIIEPTAHAPANLLWWEAAER